MAQTRRAFPQTDSGNAELFAAVYRGRVLYNHQRQRWYLWQGDWWGEDTDGAAVRLAKEAARARKKEAERRLADPEDHMDQDAANREMRWARDSENLPRLKACLTIAQAERSIADAGADWDSNPWLLGVANGVVNLRTGKLEKGRPEDRISIHTDVAFDPRAECPRFDAFLREIFEGDRELIEFVQRAIGYSLTGEGSEQCCFLADGEGSNGKSSLLEALRHVLGAYAYNMPFSTLELQSRASIPNDLAALQGKRLVTASEINESVRLNEARLKVLTGSDHVTARFLYGEFFTYRPTAKFWLSFNHRPLVGDDSHGFWRRVRLIPFRRQFSEQEADKELAAKLRAEAPGILAWAVRGCLAWQKHGLGKPTAVQAATAAYREEQDPLQAFIDEKCLVDPRARLSCTALWQEYVEWAHLNGERDRLDRRAFTRRLEQRGFHKVRVGHDRRWTWEGIWRKIDADVNFNKTPLKGFTN